MSSRAVGMMGIALAVGIATWIMSDTARAIQQPPAAADATPPNSAATNEFPKLEEVVVTSLADSGPGTLREALGAGARNITFAVGGTIQLESTLSIQHDYLAVDGASAPAPGITIRAQPCEIRDAQHVELKHLRFRDSSDDNLRIIGESRFIMIRCCSSTAAGDGAIDITLDYRSGRRPADVMIWNCLLAGTDKAMLAQSVERLAIVECLFTGNSQRNPQLHDAQFGFMRNVVCNWGAYGMRARAGSHGAIINNLFGASSRRSKANSLALLIANDDPALPEVQLYARDNFGPADFDPNQVGNSEEDGAGRASQLYDREALLNFVLEHAGALPRDEIDAQFVEQAREALSPPADEE